MTSSFTPFSSPHACIEWGTSTSTTEQCDATLFFLRFAFHFFPLFPHFTLTAPIQYTTTLQIEIENDNGSMFKLPPDLIQVYGFSRGW